MSNKKRGKYLYKRNYYLVKKYKIDYNRKFLRYDLLSEKATWYNEGYIRYKRIIYLKKMKFNKFFKFLRTLNTINYKKLKKKKSILSYRIKRKFKYFNFRNLNKIINHEIFNNLRRSLKSSLKYKVIKKKNLVQIYVLFFFIKFMMNKKRSKEKIKYKKEFIRNKILESKKLKKILFELLLKKKYGSIIHRFNKVMTLIKNIKYSSEELGEKSHLTILDSYNYLFNNNLVKKMLLFNGYNIFNYYDNKVIKLKRRYYFNFIFISNKGIKYYFNNIFLVSLKLIKIKYLKNIFYKKNFIKYYDRYLYFRNNFKFKLKKKLLNKKVNLKFFFNNNFNFYNNFSLFNLNKYLVLKKFNKIFFYTSNYNKFKVIINLLKRFKLFNFNKNINYYKKEDKIYNIFMDNKFLSKNIDVIDKFRLKDSVNIENEKKDLNCYDNDLIEYSYNDIKYRNYFYDNDDNNLIFISLKNKNILRKKKKFLYYTMIMKFHNYINYLVPRKRIGLDILRPFSYVFRNLYAFRRFKGYRDFINYDKLFFNKQNGLVLFREENFFLSPKLSMLVGENRFKNLIKTYIFYRYIDPFFYKYRIFYKYLMRNNLKLLLLNKYYLRKYKFYNKAFSLFAHIKHKRKKWKKIPFNVIEFYKFKIFFNNKFNIKKYKKLLNRKIDNFSSDYSRLSNFYKYLFCRIDLIIYNLRFFKSMKEIHFIIRNYGLLVNKVRVKNINFFLKNYDIFIFKINSYNKKLMKKKKKKLISKKLIGKVRLKKNLKKFMKESKKKERDLAILLYTEKNECLRRSFKKNMKMKDKIRLSNLRKLIKEEKRRRLIEKKILMRKKEKKEFIEYKKELREKKKKKLRDEKIEEKVKEEEKKRKLTEEEKEKIMEMEEKKLIEEERQKLIEEEKEQEKKRKKIEIKIRKKIRNKKNKKKINLNLSIIRNYIKKNKNYIYFPPYLIYSYKFKFFYINKFFLSYRFFKLNYLNFEIIKNFIKI